jgi:hypothetical protein
MKVVIFLFEERLQNGVPPVKYTDCGLHKVVQKRICA